MIAPVTSEGDKGAYSISTIFPCILPIIKVEDECENDCWIICIAISPGAKKLIKEYVSILFCNQDEIHTLLDTKVTQEALNIISQWVETIVLTLGEKGALISHLGEIIYIDPISVNVIDTTGAGDAFAAGYLYGITNNFWRPSIRHLYLQITRKHQSCYTIVR